MSQLWVIFVAGHVVAPGGNQWFENHGACIAKAAEVSGACEAVAEEPPKNSPEHLDWEKIYCIPGVYYMPNSDRTVTCPGPKNSKDSVVP